MLSLLGWSIRSWRWILEVCAGVFWVFPITPTTRWKPGYISIPRVIWEKQFHLQKSQKDRRNQRSVPKHLRFLTFRSSKCRFTNRSFCKVISLPQVSSCSNLDLLFRFSFFKKSIRKIYISSLC